MITQDHQANQGIIEVDLSQPLTNQTENECYTKIESNNTEIRLILIHKSGSSSILSCRNEVFINKNVTLGKEHVNGCQQMTEHVPVSFYPTYTTSENVEGLLIFYEGKVLSLIRYKPIVLDMDTITF